MKKAKILISIFSISIFIGFIGCSGMGKVNEKQKKGSWEQDMNKLIEKATPKDNK